MNIDMVSYYVVVCDSVKPSGGISNMQKGAQREITSCMIIAKLYTSAENSPFFFRLGFRRISGAVQNWSESKIQRSESTRKTEYIKASKRSLYILVLMSLSICIIRTLWFAVLQDDVLTVDDFIEAIICNLQNKPAIYHTVSWLHASMNNPTIMQVLHSLREYWQRCMRRWTQVTMFDSSLLNMQPVILYHIFIHFFIFLLSCSYISAHLCIHSTLC